MKILEDLLSVLNFDTEVRDIRQGVFHTGVLTRYCGLAATLPKDALRQNPPLVKSPGYLESVMPKELARMAFSDSLLEAAMGMAAINSLLEVDLGQCIEKNASEIILNRGEGRNVAIVGHFPFLSKVRERVRELWVIEKNTQAGDYAETEADRLIPRADVVAITGTSLTNHTLEHLLALCDPKAYVVMLGDSVPLAPMLFDFGVDALCGTRVVDADLALKCVSQGANYRQIKGISQLTMYRTE